MKSSPCKAPNSYSVMEMLRAPVSISADLLIKLVFKCAGNESASGLQMLKYHDLYGDHTVLSETVQATAA